MFTLRVNGERRVVHADADKPLLWALRDDLGLKGTKYGCGMGACGICLVHLDGTPARACITTVAQAAGSEITTIEGLGAHHPVIRAWIAEQVPQCGYCQPGQIMAAAALLVAHPAPTDADIAAALAGVLCRCGTYPRIPRAVRRAAHPGLEPTSRNDVSTPPVDALAGYTPGAPAGAAAGVALNPWVSIAPDGRVTVVIDRSEMGQGVATGLAMLVAEELEVDLAQLAIAFAQAAPEYVNPRLESQMTGGSTSLRAAWEPLRRAGAQARARLVQAAAQTWGVAPGACRAQDGAVVHTASGRRLPYGELAAAAAVLPPPRAVALKPREAFRLIGRSVPRLDIPAMAAGRPLYGLDVALPGMRVAAVARCPVFGGRPAGVDASAARAVPGVREVVNLDAGVAVVADDFWCAWKGREALAVTWEEGALAGLSSAGVRRRLAEAGRRPGRLAYAQGDTRRALARAHRTVEAVYETPYLAHAAMEPMNCTAQVQPGRCDLWVGTQAQGDAQRTAMALTGLPARAVHVHTTFLGGGFGRRLEQDFVTEAVQLSQALGAPVQVVWTRQDDMQHDYYRPANLTRLTAALDAEGLPVAWFQRTVGPALALEGVDLPYAIAHLRHEQVEEDPGVPTGAWRSVGASQNAFAVEGFVDELACAAGRDPVAFRHGLLAASPRHRGVLARAAEAAGWGRPAAGRHQGVAVYRSYGSWVAQVAEASVDDGGAITVHRIVCAIDCGTCINPDAVVAQVEGGIVFGLSAALHGEITLADGRVQQRGFADYPIVTLADCPQIEVHILESREPPGGVGEPAVPPVAPAVANAVFAATGERLRTLPLRPRPAGRE